MTEVVTVLDHLLHEICYVCNETVDLGLFDGRLDLILRVLVLNLATRDCIILCRSRLVLRQLLEDLIILVG